MRVQAPFLLNSAVGRIVAAAALAFALVGAGLGIGVGHLANSALTERTLELIEADVRTAAALLQAGGVPAIIAGLGAPDVHSRHVLLDQNDVPHAGGLNLSTDDRRRLAAGELVAHNDARAGVKPVIYVGRLAPMPNGLQLMVVRDVAGQIAFIDRLRQLLFASLGTLALIAFGASLMAHRVTMRRIARVSEASRAMAAGHLSARIPRDYSNDDFDCLVRDVNVMLGRIEDLMGTVREVSDNVAHDLRTPLTRLRNSAETALRTPDMTPQQAEALERVITEADQIIRMFNALLEISRLEGEGVTATFEAFDLSAFVTDMVEFYAPLAEDQGLRIVADVKPALMLTGNRHLVGQVLSNLLENALKYGAPTDPTAHNRAVRVSLSRTADGMIKLRVVDSGPGIPAADRDRVLKRFVRLDTSRSKPGTGLGLSLVAAIVRLHQGILELGDNSPGLNAVVTLPAGAVTAAALIIPRAANALANAQ